jgi:hypothetical protein
MRFAGRPSWQIGIGQRQELVIALFVRDAAGVEQTAAPLGLPRLDPQVEPAGTGSLDGTDDWNAWWTELITAPGHAVWRRLVPPDFGDFGETPALQQLLQRHWPAALAWSQTSTTEHAEFMRSNRGDPLWDVVADVERALNRSARPFDLRIDEVPVAGRDWWQVGPEHFLISPGLLRDREAFHTRLRPEIERLA